MIDILEEKKFKVEINNEIVTVRALEIRFKDTRLSHIPFFLYSGSDITKSTNYNYHLYCAINGKRVWTIGQYLETSLETLRTVGNAFIDQIVIIVNNFINSFDYFDEYGKLFDIPVSIINKKNSATYSLQSREIASLVRMIPFNTYFDTIVCGVPLSFVSNDTMLVNCVAILPKPMAIKRHFIEDETILSRYIPELRYIGTAKERIDIFSNNSDAPCILYYPNENILVTSLITMNDLSFLTKVVSILDLKSMFKPNKLSITLGVDPEFEYVHNKEVIIPPNELNGCCRLRGKIGSDGHGSQIEIRTSPSTNENDIVEDMKKSFGKISYINLSAISKKESCGGHIHIGAKIQNILAKVTLDEKIRFLFDHFLGKQFIKINSDLRQICGFGRLNDFRKQSWGFEYRTLPAACFQNPKIVRIILKIARNICSKYYSHLPITYNRLLKYEDYERVCGLTKSEYKYFVNFSSIFNKTKERNIIKFWCKSTSKSKFTIEFCDSWSEDTIKLFKKEFEGLITPFHIKIIMYGLKNDNEIAGIGDGYNKLVNHPKGLKHLPNGICFGFPKSYRMSTDKTRVIKICKNIRLKLNKIFENYVGESDCNTLMLFPEEITGKIDKYPRFREIIDNLTPQLLNTRVPDTYVSRDNNDFDELIQDNY